MATLERTWTISPDVPITNTTITTQYQSMVFDIKTRMLSLAGAVLGPNCNSVTSNAGPTDTITTVANIVRGTDGSQVHSYFVITLGDQHILFDCNSASGSPNASNMDTWMSSQPYALHGTPLSNRPVAVVGTELGPLSRPLCHSTSVVTRVINAWRDNVGTLIWSSKRPGEVLSDVGLIVAHTANPASSAFRRAVYLGPYFYYSSLGSNAYWMSHRSDGAVGTNVRAQSVEWGNTSLPGGINETGGLERSSIVLKSDSGSSADGRALRRLPDVFGIPPLSARNTRDALDLDPYRVMTYDSLALPSLAAQADFS